MASELIKNSNDFYPNKNIYFGEVINNDDVNLSGNIIVKIPEIDKNDNEIPYSYPAFNFQFYKILPKKGERVMIILEKDSISDNSFIQYKRYWLAISISNQQYLDNSKFYFDSNSNEINGYIKNNISIKALKDSLGTYPLNGEIALYGRKNTDILFRDNELLLRSGRHEKENPVKYNKKNNAYIQIKNRKNYINSENFELIEVDIPPEYLFKITILENVNLIKIFDIKNDIVIEKISESYSNYNVCLYETKKILNDLKQKYIKWIINTNDSEIAKGSQLFENSKEIMKKEIESTNETNPSVINLVAEKINLINVNNNKYNLNDPKKTIDEINQKEINENLEPMVKGNSLIEFLNLIKEFALNHQHPHHGMKAVNDEILKKLSLFDLNTINSKNFKLE